MGCGPPSTKRSSHDVFPILLRALSKAAARQFAPHVTARRVLLSEPKTRLSAVACRARVARQIRYQSAARNRSAFCRALGAQSGNWKNGNYPPSPASRQIAGVAVGYRPCWRLVTRRRCQATRPLVMAAHLAGRASGDGEKGGNFFPRLRTPMIPSELGCAPRQRRGKCREQEPRCRACMARDRLSWFARTTPAVVVNFVINPRRPRPASRPLASLPHPQDPYPAPNPQI